MPWCPECKLEYREGFTECSDCNCNLVSEIEELDENVEYDHEVYLTSVSDRVKADIIESLLNANGIPVLRKYRESGDYTNVLMGHSVFGVDLYVPSGLFENAQALIDSTNEPSVELIDEDWDYDTYNNDSFEEENTSSSKSKINASIIIAVIVGVVVLGLLVSRIL